VTDSIELIPLFPLNTVLLPGVALPLHIFEERYKAMVSRCVLGGGRFGVVLISAGQEVGGPAVPYGVGTTARIVEIDKLDNGRLNLVCVGERRFRIVEHVEGQPYQQARVEYWPDQPEPDCDVEELAAATRNALRQFLSLGREDPGDALERLPSSAVDLANVIAASLPLDLPERQALLEKPGICARLRRISALLLEETGMLRALGAVRYIVARPSAFSSN
jgi:Lon protease-like protein